MAVRTSLAKPPDGPERIRLEQAGLGSRYRLRGRLRRRAGAPVLLAVDALDGQLVVIKAATDPDAAGAETEVLRALDHPGVVRFRDRLEIDGEHWLVLDYVPGDSLEARLRSAGPMAPEEVAGLLRALAEALDHVHARGFVHRDLKPANVLIGEDGRPVIVDFGAARPLADAARSEGTSALSEGYAAPEQYLEGEAEGPWTDLYALAALGFAVLTGRPPPAALERLDRSVPLDVSALRDAPQLIRPLERALALSTAERPQTVAEFLALLESGPGASSADDDEGVPTVRVPRRPRRRPVAIEAALAGPGPAGRRRLAPWLLALVLVVVALTAAAFAARPLYDRHVKTTWIVDASGAGDVATIGEALDRAGDGATIVIRPGIYGESLVLARPAHLVAEEGDERPVVAPPAGPCLLTTASGGSTRGLAFQGSETAGVACLAVSGGDLRIEDSRIEASAGPAIEVRAGARPEIRGGEVLGTGIVIREGSQPVINDLTIEAVEGPSIIVRSGALPEVSGNRIVGSGPVVFAEGSAGLFDGNEIRDARSNGVEVSSGATPSMRDNRITAPAEAGVFIYGEGQARLEQNRIEDSGLSAIVLSEEARAAVVGNEVSGSGEHGVLVLDGASAVIEDNKIEGSRGRGIAIAPEAEATVDGNRMSGNRSGAVLDARTRTGSSDGGA